MKLTSTGAWNCRASRLGLLALTLLLSAFPSVAVERGAPKDAATSRRKCLTSYLDDIGNGFDARLAEITSPTEKGNPVVQPTDDLATLYRLANLNQKNFEKLLRKIAMDTHAEARFAPMKSMERSESKVRSKLRGHTEALVDVLRGTMIFDRLEQLADIKKSISRWAMDVKFRDRFESPKEHGYKDLQAIVLVPPSQKGDSPIWAEIQVHFRPLYEAKKQKGDAIYNQWRQIQEMGASRDLTPVEKEKITTLQEQEKALYEHALISK